MDWRNGAAAYVEGTKGLERHRDLSRSIYSEALLDSMTSLRNIGIVAAVMGAVGTIAMMLHAVSWQVADAITLAFLLWACLPYIVLLISNFRIHRGTLRLLQASPSSSPPLS